MRRLVVVAVVATGGAAMGQATSYVENLEAYGDWAKFDCAAEFSEPVTLRKGLEVDGGVSAGEGTIAGKLRVGGAAVLNGGLEVGAGASLTANGPMVAKAGLEVVSGGLKVSNGAVTVGSLDVQGRALFSGGVGVGTSGGTRRLSVSTSSAEDGIEVLGRTDADRVSLVTNLATGQRNGMAHEGDRALVFPGSGGLVIGPESAEKAGIRVDGYGNVMIGKEEPYNWGDPGYGSLSVNEIYVGSIRPIYGGKIVIDPGGQSHVRDWNVMGDLRAYSFYAQMAEVWEMKVSADLTVGGQVFASGFQNVSDAREKTVLADIDSRGAAEQIRQLKPKVYVWKDGRDSREKLGFVAQEAGAVVPEALSTVEGRGYGDLKVLSYDMLYTLNVAATKHLLETVEKQQAEIEALKAEVVRMRR